MDPAPLGPRGHPGLLNAELWGGLLAGFGAALVATPAGVSGAFLLVPWQVLVLGRTGVSVSSTSLVFNLVAAPLAVARFRRTGNLDITLARAVLVGSVPGVAVGVLARIHLLEAPAPFLVVSGAVLLTLAAALMVRRRARGPERPPGRDAQAGPGEHSAPEPASNVTGWAFATAVAGGAYGIGGGALLAPILVIRGWPIGRVVGATLVGTAVTSAFALAAYLVMGASDAAPEWGLGVAFGVGGALGAIAGTRVHHLVAPDLLVRLLAAITAVAGVGALVQATSV